MNRDEIILAFEREFSVHGIQIGKVIGITAKREACRIAICKARKQSMQLTDDMTYAAAFFVAFGESIERRAVPREDDSKFASFDLDEDDDAE